MACPVIMPLRLQRLVLPPLLHPQGRALVRYVFDDPGGYPKASVITVVLDASGLDCWSPPVALPGIVKNSAFLSRSPI